MKKLKATLAKCFVISLAVLIPTGCALLTSGNELTRTPTCEALTKPTLTETTANADGGVTIPKRDLSDLLLYIDALEECADVEH